MIYDLLDKIYKIFIGFFKFSLKLEVEKCGGAIIRGRAWIRENTRDSRTRLDTHRCFSLSIEGP